MKFKGVDITPLMGIGGWAIDVIEKSIPNKVAYTYSEPHKAWFVWDFYPTAFLGPHMVIFSIFPEERFTPELAEEVIVKPWLEARFERFVFSMIWWFKVIGELSIEEIKQLVQGIPEGVKEQRELEIKIPLLWSYPEGLEKGVYTFFTYEPKENGSINPVPLNKVSMILGSNIKEIPHELSGEFWDWHTFVWTGEKGKEINSYLLLPFPLFIGIKGSIDEAINIKNTILEEIEEDIKENPQLLKGVELLLMGTKWYEKLQKLKKELKKIQV